MLRFGAFGLHETISLGSAGVGGRMSVRTLDEPVFTTAKLIALFDEDWTAPISKTLIVPSEFEIGDARLIEGTPWGGELTLINNGIFSGLGGASNSGTGGNGLTVQLTGDQGQPLLINNANGIIRAGGGGGGRGGAGGSGTYSYQEGPRLDGSTYWFADSSRSDGTDYYSLSVVFNGATIVYSGSQSSPHPWYNAGQGSSGGWLYQRTGGRNSYSRYAVLRRQDRTSAGGSGGTGGRGQGFDDAAATGTSGGAGETNAGTGGAGGSGGDWGQIGSAGLSGSSGNVAAGSLGSTGGLPGKAITGAYLLTGEGTLIGELG